MTRLLAINKLLEPAQLKELNSIKRHLTLISKCICIEEHPYNIYIFNSSLPVEDSLLPYVVWDITIDKEFVKYKGKRYNIFDIATKAYKGPRDYYEFDVNINGEKLRISYTEEQLNWKKLSPLLSERDRKSKVQFVAISVELQNLMADISAEYNCKIKVVSNVSRLIDKTPKGFLILRSLNGGAFNSTSVKNMFTSLEDYLVYGIQETCDWMRIRDDVVYIQFLDKFFSRKLKIFIDTEDEAVFIRKLTKV